MMEENLQKRYDELFLDDFIKAFDQITNQQGDIMITGEIKNKIDKVWTDMWAGGITNPLTVIEQLTYMMFIHSLDEKELKNESFEALTGEKIQKIF